jgi:hypothetical protein
MDIKEIKTKQHLLIVLAELKDYCDPLKLIGPTPLEDEIKKWLRQLKRDEYIEANKPLLWIVDNPAPLVRITPIGKRIAFREYLKLLPEVNDSDFVQTITSLCYSRSKEVQRDIMIALNINLKE